MIDDNTGNYQSNQMVIITQLTFVYYNRDQIYVTICFAQNARPLFQVSLHK